MSNMEHPGNLRTALDRAMEGRRLLAAGDYKGAIAACNEALALDSSLRGAHLTRTNAQRLLKPGSGIEAQKVERDDQDQAATRENRPPRLAINEQLRKDVTFEGSPPLFGGNIVGSSVRVLANIVLAMIPPVGIALPLWAWYQWDLPAWLALVIASSVWAYSLILALVAAGDKMHNTKYVELGNGIVEDIQQSSTGMNAFGVRTEPDIQQFTAQESMTGQLRKGDSVVFAYVPLSLDPGTSRANQRGPERSTAIGDILSVAKIEWS